MLQHKGKAKTANRDTARMLPHDSLAEAGVISSMLVWPKIIPKAADALSPEDFYYEKHQHIFSGLCALGHAADLITLRNWLSERGLLDKAGGQAYLAQLVNTASTGAGWQYWSEIVKKHAEKRRIVILCQNTIESCLSQYSDIEEVLSNHHQGLTDLEIGDKWRHKRGVCIENVYDAERCLEAYREYVKTLKQNRFITGIHEIDKRIRGVSGGEVLFIIARGGTFKTAILQNLLKNYVNNSSWGAIFFTIEMPIPAITERYHQIIDGSPGKDIEEFYRTDKDGVQGLVSDLERRFTQEIKNLYFVDVKVSVKDIIAYVRLVQNRKKIKVGLIGIDYLGLMDGEEQSEYEAVSNLARGMKDLAKLLNIPVVVICQTSRKAGSGNVEVTLDMGRGSGVIEEAADFILGLWQDGDDLVCKILKNRKGPKGSSWVLDLNPENLRLGASARKWESRSKGKGIEI